MAPSPPKLSRLTELLIRLGLRTRAGRLAALHLFARWLTRPMRQRILRTPSDLALAWEPFACRSEDGYRLRGWVVSPPAPRATVLLFHGIRNTREQTLSRLTFLVPAGYRCLAVDHRGHGESQGRRATFGYTERHDVQAVLGHALERWPGSPMAAVGLSMGAAALCYGAADFRRHFRAIVLESLYHDIVTAFMNRLRLGQYPPFVRSLAGDILRQCERQVGAPAQRLTPADHIADFAPTPLLFVTGTADQHSTPDEAERLFARRRGPAELLLVPGADHHDVCETGGEAYRRHLLAFLGRHLSDACSPQVA